MTSRGSLYSRFGKRLVDLILAVPTALTLLPLIAVMALAIRWQLGSPVLFRQKRPGRGGRLFAILKFRTMLEATDEKGDPLPDGARVTRFGSLLRRTSLDELPELWNVVRGEMSLVGPRPLRARYLPLYSGRQARRHEVRPGMTGWAQVNGRNTLTWEDKFELDVWYAENLSFSLDLRILWRTIWLTLSGRGVSAPAQATMPEFFGSAPQQDRVEKHDT